MRGADILGPGGVRCAATAGGWPDRGLKAGDKLIASHEPAGVTIEESGPARVVICIKGNYTPGDKDKKFYEFTAHLTFAANDPSVGIIYGLNNTKLDPALHGNKHDAYVWPLQDVSLTADLAIGDKAVASALGDAGKAISADVADDPLLLNQTKIDAFEISLAGKQQSTGKQSGGAIDVTGNGRGLAAARRYFHSEWPAALTGSARELRIGLLPHEATDAFHLQPGQRKDWDVRLAFHGANATDLKNLSAEQETLLLFRPEPAWMVRAAGLTGSWSAGLSLEKGTQKPALRRTPGLMEDGMGRAAVDSKFPSNGWNAFGSIHGWNAGGGHWNEDSVFWKWVLYADGAEFDDSEIRALWAADLCPIHFENLDLDVFGDLPFYNLFDQCKTDILTDPAFAGQIVKHLESPDTGHMAMWMWDEYYLLTGDPRVREAICELGEYARAHLRRQTFQDGKLLDADADPELKLDTRYFGWPLYCLCQEYELTGDPRILSEARVAARAFRNTARTSPIGQLVINAAPKDSKAPVGPSEGRYAQKIAAGDGTASQVRECHNSASLVFANFQHGYVMFALREYFTISHDVEALDTLVGEVDHFCKHILIHNPQGKPAGWSYVFADYWGPYTWADAQPPENKPGKGATEGFIGFNSSNVFTCDALARIYPLTGRADLLDMLKESKSGITIRGSSGNENRINDLLMAINHPKIDSAAPAAIKDLTAEALGGGKVKLTWTAPGRDGDTGQAAWYQVKWSPAPIVELTQGWPDRTEPLPATNDDWHARAKAFNAKQRAFWSVFNLSGAPSPAAAGTKESMTAEGLAGGKIYIAIKSWNDVGNISDLSNVVEVEVR